MSASAAWADGGVLWIGGAVLGGVLFLAWHPLRRHLSDAYDFLRTRRLPLWIALIALGLEELTGARVESAVDVMALMNGGDWQTAALPLAKACALESMTLLHQAIPPLPLAALLPVWVVMATVGLVRYPYRYLKEKLRPEQRGVLLVMSALTVVWSGVYVLSKGTQPRAELEAVMQPVTLIFAALATAAYQVWLARAVIQWADPREAEMSPRDEAIARWQNVLWLGAFNAAWTAFAMWIGSDATWRAWSSLAEVLFVFAPLPVAIAAERGSLAQAGGGALRMLWRGWLPLLVWVATAMVLLAVARGAADASATVNADAARAVRVLVTGVLHAWLLPAAMLLLYRRGFPAQDAGSY